jgi:Fe-S oxidoreductase
MQAWQTPERQVQDKALQATMANLTQDRIQTVIQNVLSSEVGSRLMAYRKSCVRCGMCAHACHFCVSHDLDPTYSPVGKSSQTIWEMVDKRGQVSPEFMERAARIAFTECNLCKRCAMYCPLGIDTSYMMLVVRRICFHLGLVPQYIQDTANSHAVTTNQMWVKDNEWIDTLQWQEEELRDELPTARIPLEQEGADIMYSVIGPEPKFQPQLIYQAALIMNLAGVSWTMPATPGWDNSDMTMYIRDDSLTARIKKKHFDTAMRLKVKKIVMGECGHAFRSIYDVGNRQLAWKLYPIPVQHAIHFYWELLQQGKIKIKEKYSKPVTIHDPCNIIRGRGLHQKLREVVHMCCSDVREMQPNMEHNYCCAAGGGVINCGPPFKDVRIKGNRVKAEQIKATEAETVIAPCHNCHSGLEDIVKNYEIGTEIHFLMDILNQCMEKPGAIEE